MSDPRFLIAVIAIGVAAVFDLIVAFVPTRLDIQLVTMILTALNTNGLTVAIQYWLGSSNSSQNKDETINTLTKKVGP